MNRTATASHTHANGQRSHLRRTIALARRRRRSLGPRTPLPLGAVLADAVAATVGSWRFIMVQSGLIIAWMTGNVLSGGGAWDPYPFILLNLLLSFQAAYTAPVIMMSQNRQSEVDRDRALADYQVNIRAEAEIARLHEKIDLMREQQLLEVTQLLKAALTRIEALEGRGTPA
ncbi:DUF1003 domain-containing protein [Roseomonas eburnea]|uniref:DUF1003 domain-containing protein n=1 Tax=Neoroseomonas eburnea TaxID=1346889 RepID=A0A9X9XFW0_9PROT|nr:DUF1003 domain-containing protein [Neoroseomonas eburnea]MBR0682596.1 DUF1003 domain-containing protein [Neoroseomonas eburnea]